jgi:uncharacterized protein YdcH (DUF465 family)
MNPAHPDCSRTASAERGVVACARPNDPAFLRSAATQPWAAVAAHASGKRITGGSAMFESKRDDVEALMKADPEFRRLFLHHKELDSKVRDAELGVLPVDDTTLNGMKREKLYAKDRLTRMWDQRLSAAH